MWAFCLDRRGDKNLVLIPYVRARGKPNCRFLCFRSEHDGDAYAVFCSREIIEGVVAEQWRWTGGAPLQNLLRAPKPDGFGSPTASVSLNKPQLQSLIIAISKWIACLLLAKKSQTACVLGGLARWMISDPGDMHCRKAWWLYQVEILQSASFHWFPADLQSFPEELNIRNSEIFSTTCSGTSSTVAVRFIATVHPLSGFLSLLDFLQCTLEL